MSWLGDALNINVDSSDDNDTGINLDFSRSDLNPSNWSGDAGSFLQRPLDNPVAGLLTGFMAGFGGLPGALVGQFNQSNRQAFEQQQNTFNQYQAQQDRLMRDEQNRRFQQEISSSWAAYGVQRRSQITSGGGRSSGSPLGPMTANDIYLGGR
jgi:hypothetical protein